MAMNDGLRVPLLLRMASHPLRWALLTELASSDRRVRELVAALDAPQNLVSYHLRLLRSAGLLDVRRSSFDGRDSYYHLNVANCAAAFGEAASALHPALASTATSKAAKGSVLFLCTGNSARSPIAEALLRHRSSGRIRVASAGSHPKPQIHKYAVRVMRADYGIDLSKGRPHPLTAVTRRRFDHVITLCDKVYEFVRENGPAPTMHWSLPDPAASDASDQTRYRQFRSMANEIDTRIQYLLPVLAHHANAKEE
jgi:ArsR family transcriptional regulator, arsenate/arsenite/antimonite-responsive transcriptional repressor / arsenate reductase (thioredoxin)